MVDLTKVHKKKYRFAAFISFLLNIGPFLTFTAMAYFSGTAVNSKVTLSLTLILVAIFTCYAYYKKMVMRSNLWILLIGLWICLDNIITILIVFACCQIVDELFVTPYMLYHKGKYEHYKDNDEYMKNKGMI